ncbi:MAG: YebC/PmpR family DNA-binding transcriptional regulator [Alphaproteobacteria bacterium]|nr:YebC/PmpR family DNA-binding transcriptional regulator [Alphaproteobacteria bacterium]
MAGHSHWKGIMHRKGAQDAKRAKVFTKLIRELTVSAKQGLPDPAFNPRLRAAILAARAANMSRDTVERAIKKGTGGEGGAYEEVRYEGYGPGGTAIIVEALTDNRNRTASEVRTAFGKHGGALAETGSVSFQFQRVGLIAYPAAAGSAEKVFDVALEAGANDVESWDDGHEIFCDTDTLNAVREKLEAALGEPASAKLTWRPGARVPVADDAAETLFKLIDSLEDNDDVQTVISNFDVADDVLARFDA